MTAIAIELTLVIVLVVAGVVFRRTREPRPAEALDPPCDSLPR